MRLVVVLLRGVLSSSEDGQLAAIRDALCAVEPAVVRVVHYSYRYPDGTAYTACDTQQSVGTSAQRLDAQLAALARLYPNARFLLVGHSLGGVVAAAWAATVAAPEGLARTAAVVTLDSPLQGVPWLGGLNRLTTWLPAAWLGHGQSLACYGGVLAAELATAVPGAPPSALLPVLEQAPARLAAHGGRFYSVASCDDGIIWCTSAVLPESEQVIVRAGTCDEATLAALRERWPTLAVDRLSESWAELWAWLTDPGNPQLLALADPRLAPRCLDESHGRIVRDPATLDWLVDLATRALRAAAAPRQPGAGRAAGAP